MTADIRSTAFPCSCGEYLPPPTGYVAMEQQVEVEEFEPPIFDGIIHRRATGRQRVRHTFHKWGPWTESGAAI